MNVIEVNNLKSIAGQKRVRGFEKCDKRCCNGLSHASF